MGLIFNRMANRILRDWTDSDKIDSLSSDAERFFTRLIMKADDFGYFHAHPSLIIAALFPLKIDKIDLEDVEQWIDECERSGLILTYTVNGRKYLQIKNFSQRLRIMTPKFPQPADECQQPAVNCPPETKRSRNEVEVEDEGNNIQAKNSEFGKQFSQTESLMENAMRTAKAFNLDWQRERILDYLRAYVNEMNAKQEVKPKFKDFSSHFVSWMKIHAKKVQPSQVQPQYKPLDGN